MNMLLAVRSGPGAGAGNFRATAPRVIFKRLARAAGWICGHIQLSIGRRRLIQTRRHFWRIIFGRRGRRADGESPESACCQLCVDDAATFNNGWLQELPDRYETPRGQSRLCPLRKRLGLNRRSGADTVTKTFARSRSNANWYRRFVHRHVDHS